MSKDDHTRPDDLESTELESTELTPSDASSRQWIGPYRLLQKIGEGGMGEVWLAEQDKPIRRRVALKLIKLGMDTKQVIARFEAERQALALMDHSNVARVIDAGATPEGKPYFAMEYVKGEPITDYCDKHQLTTKERLELFTQVCEGVQHAHQKGIIHRDIKPSNIMVAIDGDKPVPKIIDFGVAKATEHRLTEQTLLTQMGVLIGTPEYMSPEQAEMTGLDIDTRTDVYSLGVLLYELLVGALPFDPQELRQAGFDEIRRKIREDQPSRPSTRISTLGEALRISATDRRTDPESLARELRGDLDWITMRALEKDRTRRYGSPHHLAADIERSLKNEPVFAGPPTIAYRARKFMRRHRARLAAGFAAVLAIGTIVALTVSLEKRKSADELSRIRDTLEQVVKTGETATSLEPAWGHLKQRLLTHIRQHGTRVDRKTGGPLVQDFLIPEDELGNLMRRASAQLKLDVPSFGLISDSPELEFVAPLHVLDLHAPHGPRLADSYIADIEVSWDGGDWHLVKVHTGGIRGGLGFTIGLLDIVGHEGLSTGPHRLEARTTFSFLPHLSERVRNRLQIDEVRNGQDPGWLPTHDRPEPVFRETRSLGVFEINLYGEYPADFPRAIPWDSSLGAIESWLAIEKIRIDRYVRSSGEPFRRPCVSVVGKIREDLPLPIAFNATVSFSEDALDVVSFPFVLGRGRFHGSNAIERNDRADDSVATEVDYCQRPQWKLKEPGEDGNYRGTLRLVPSRDLALETKRLQRYVNQLVSFEVPIEIVTESLAR